MTPAMTAAWTVLVPLAQKAPDPADVKPGWAGFLTFIFLVAAVTLLVLSFRKQLKKVNFEERGADTARGDDTERGADTARGDGAGAAAEAKNAAPDDGEAGTRPT